MADEEWVVIVAISLPSAFGKPTVDEYGRGSEGLCPLPDGRGSENLF